MEMLARVTVRGAKLFRGNLDGKDVDSGKIFVDVELKGETSWGTCTQELKCEGSALVDSISQMPFPFLAEIGMQEMSNGKVATKVVTSIKPMQRVADEKPAKQAA